MNGEAWQSDEIRPSTVHRAYGRGAAGYDAFVGMIPGYRTHLRVSASRMGLGEGYGLRLLDIGCGTGVSTEALLTTVKGAEVVAVDASTEMLAVARRKNWSPRVSFVHAKLETLAEAGIEGPFDGILASYLVSNLPDAEHGLRRLLSLLAPGAPLAVHDYAVGGTRGRARWATAGWGYLLPLAAARWGVSDLLRYRLKRVASAGGPEQMKLRMERAGFGDVRVQTMGGVQQHLVHTFLGRRPEEPDVVGERKARSSALAAAGWRPVGAPGRDTPQDDGPVDEGGPEDPGYADELPDEVVEDTGGEGDAAEDGADPAPRPDGPSGAGPRDPDDDAPDRPRGRGASLAGRWRGTPAPAEPAGDGTGSQQDGPDEADAAARPDDRDPSGTGTGTGTGTGSGSGTGSADRAAPADDDPTGRADGTSGPGDADTGSGDTRSDGPDDELPTPPTGTRTVR
ncbi:MULTISPECIES: methyltransferase domain-containing protein [unclassified Pseudonocardia]|uniref:methyltransferase domain-containing protein n=1 Tax=unclassified Pseudonocardia TaxID=2619320 RepID=UPI00094B31CE|nr:MULTISPECIES: methyltransferase domain-containing protein [unclassified Pseudonocardia]OLL75803.1 CrtT-methyltransferase-like protein [Pseudonocardia sp. Ae150A_Ps1]OLL84087.1 CrtT-methyltransferase-like protein [Pseudonocardia sp. Ae263_Ps1]OLL95895.1 CrtT-methyltransferase-like protein [Pseudonocardia sp. Ae356_Ps1]